MIGVELGIPHGSIGPTRARCLDKLRRHPALAALVNPGHDGLRYGPLQAAFAVTVVSARHAPAAAEPDHG